jgi:NAD(P)-dependent dehydrogenase (short-subunit alcohol dehydrogenase family)
MERILDTGHKVVIVTGASQGIGAGLVKAFRDRSYRVIANSRSIRPANDPHVLAIAGDISDRATVRQVVEEGLHRFGRIDSLVNNAGIFISKAFTDYSDSDFSRVLSVNLAGFFHITQAAIAEMDRQRSGHVINVTASLVDQPNSKVPAALASLTKGGLNAATRALAIEYAKRGIRVNAVAPGVIKTPMHAPETHEALAHLHPVGRIGEIHDVVEAVLFLETATFVTGEILHVDGGQSAGH